MSEPIAYPNREHRNADEAASRRALKALDGIDAEVAILRRRVESGTADGDDTATLATLAHEVTKHLTALGWLREVREWHAADTAG